MNRIQFVETFIRREDAERFVEEALPHAHVVQRR